MIDLYTDDWDDIDEWDNTNTSTDDLGMMELWVSRDAVTTVIKAARGFITESDDPNAILDAIAAISDAVEEAGEDPLPL